MIYIKVNSKIHLTGNILKDVSGEIKTSLTMDNPQWIENERMGRWNGNTPRKLTFYQEDQGELVIPRGYTRKATDILKSKGQKFQLIIQTRELAEAEYTFSGKLRPYQKDAVKKILERRFGVVQMPPGSGKTVVALYCIAHRKQPALVIVHTKELMLQWAKRAESFLELRGEQLGLLGDGHDSVGSRLTIAIVRSLYRKAREVSKRIGFLVVDECHHVPARTFEEAVSAFDTHYMLGLSATPQRRDQLTRLIYLYLGDRVYEVDLADLQQSGTVMGARLVVRDTEFDYPYANDYQAMISVLTADPARNQLIAKDVIRYVQRSSPPALVVSERKAQCHQIADFIRKAGIAAEVLTGELSAKRRQEIVSDLAAGKVPVLVSTIQLIGEGFDQKNLSALFLATPIRYPARLQQVAGRILRSQHGKQTPLIYDYQDRNGVLQASFHSRLQTYQRMGIDAGPN